MKGQVLCLITLFRLDERLIHGQVATRWTKFYEINRIIIANDAAANNKIVQNALLMAAPQNCKVAIVSLDRAVELIQDPRSAKLRIMLMVKSPKDALELVNRLPGKIKEINVGNYGREVHEAVVQQRKTYSLHLYCTEEEAQQFRALAACGLPCNYQVIPEDAPQSVMKIFE